MAESAVAVRAEESVTELTELTELTERFKLAFRRHPAGVALISAQGPGGPVGLTASSVASVSAVPPVLVFSVTTTTGSAGVILGATSCVVHLLRAENVEVAQAFARSGEPRFTPEQGWAVRAGGERVLPNAGSMLHCRIADTVRVGGSTLVIAEVQGVENGEPGDPLIYHDRRFHRLDEAHPALG